MNNLSKVIGLYQAYHEVTVCIQLNIELSIEGIQG